MEGLELTKLGPENAKDLQALLGMYIEVFGEPDYPKTTDYLPALLDKAIFIIATKDDELIGGLTAHILPSIYGDYSEIYLYDLAVKVKYQRQGVGTRLLEFLMDFGRRHGAKEVFVQADTPDTEARNFYKKNGGIEEDVRHYSFPI